MSLATSSQLPFDLCPLDRVEEVNRENTLPALPKFEVRTFDSSCAFEILLGF